MFGKDKKKSGHIDSLIGQGSQIQGDVVFSGGLHVDGKIKGKVIARDADAVLTLSDQGVIEGEVRVHNIILNGRVVGDVHAAEHVELRAHAKVTGSVYYKLIEMVVGAEVNGSLVHREEGAPVRQPVAEMTEKAARADT